MIYQQIGHGPEMEALDSYLKFKNLADSHPLASEDRPEPRENGATVIWMSMTVIHVDWRFDAVKIHATKQKWPS